MNAAFFRRDSTWRLTCAALVACAMSSMGCYRYAVVRVNELTPAMAVRVELSAVAVDRMRQGPDSLVRLINGFNVSGTVSRLSADTVMLAVPTSYMEANVRLRTRLHDLPLLRTDLQRVRERRLDRARTTWAGAALGAVAIVSAGYVLNWGGSSKGSIPKPVDPTDMRTPAIPGSMVP